MSAAATEPPGAGRPTPRARLVTFAALVAALLVGTAAYIYAARVRTPLDRGLDVRAHDPAALAEMRRGAYVAFRSLEPGSGDGFGTIAFAPLDRLEARQGTTLRCHRLYTAGGETLCLTITRDAKISYQAVILDDAFEVQRVVDAVSGAPSRVRVSRDGRFAGYTVFTARDSYLQTGFSTRTRLVEIASGRTIADLEEFEATRDGAPFRAVDFNYWGVTFTADPDRFYATLGTGGHTYLVEGRVSARRVTVLRDGIECPSLSPGGTRIAFKKKFVEGRQTIWRPAIYDLRTGAETVLAETRSIDDQIEWLDEATILYGMRYPIPSARLAHIWALPADGTGAPVIFLKNAESPAIVRR